MSVEDSEREESKEGRRAYFNNTSFRIYSTSNAWGDLSLPQATGTLLSLFLSLSLSGALYRSFLRRYTIDRQLLSTRYQSKTLTHSPLARIVYCISNSSDYWMMSITLRFTCSDKITVIRYIRIFVRETWGHWKFWYQWPGWLTINTST